MKKLIKKISPNNYGYYKNVTLALLKILTLRKQASCRLFKKSKCMNAIPPRGLMRAKRKRKNRNLQSQGRV